MTFEEKIRTLQTYLSHVDDNYRDSYKTDIALFFNDDFRPENPLLIFFNHFDDKNEITKWVDLVTSQIVLKFDEEFEDIGSVSFPINQAIINLGIHVFGKAALACKYFRTIISGLESFPRYDSYCSCAFWGRERLT